MNHLHCFTNHTLIKKKKAGVSLRIIDVKKSKSPGNEYNCRGPIKPTWALANNCLMYKHYVLYTDHYQVVGHRNSDYKCIC